MDEIGSWLLFLPPSLLSFNKVQFENGLVCILNIWASHCVQVLPITRSSAHTATMWNRDLSLAFAWCFPALIAWTCDFTGPRLHLYTPFSLSIEHFHLSSIQANWIKFEQYSYCRALCPCVAALFYGSGARCQPRVPAVIKALRTTSTISARSQHACWAFPCKKTNQFSVESC